VAWSIAAPITVLLVSMKRSQRLSRHITKAWQNVLSRVGAGAFLWSEGRCEDARRALAIQTESDGVAPIPDSISRKASASSIGAPDPGDPKLVDGREA